MSKFVQSLLCSMTHSGSLSLSPRHRWYCIRFENPTYKVSFYMLSKQDQARWRLGKKFTLLRQKHGNQYYGFTSMKISN